MVTRREFPMAIPDIRAACAAALVAATLLAATAAAADTSGRDPFGRPAVPGLGWACGLDHARLCPRIDLADRAVLGCLSGHHRALSPRCLDHLRLAATVELCAPDFRQHCRGVLPGRGRVLSCLAGHRDHLSRPCARALAEIAPGRWARGRGAGFRAPENDIDDADDADRDPAERSEPPIK
jgi:hypothetical protein